jgi:hypothetical protein
VTACNVRTVRTYPARPLRYGTDYRDIRLFASYPYTYRIQIELADRAIFELYCSSDFSTAGIFARAPSINTGTTHTTKTSKFTRDHNTAVSNSYIQ